MLTRQHEFANQYIQSKWRSTYRLHMCGLCQSLNDNYGFMYRLLTMHEMTLFNLLISAQLVEEPIALEKSCPLNPLKKEKTNSGIASQKAADTAVILGRAGFQDQVDDSINKKWFWSLVLNSTKTAGEKAFRRLIQNYDQTDIFDSLSKNQLIAEQDFKDTAIPTELASKELFKISAQLGDTTENLSVIEIIGAAYGRFVYLMDVYRDYLDDLKAGEFNPLKPFTLQDKDRIILNKDGLEWLSCEIHKIRMILANNFEKIKFYRYQDLLFSLIVQPVVDADERLFQYIKNHQQVVFRRTKLIDMAKVALFIIPPTAISISLVSSIPLFFAAGPGCGNGCGNICQGSSNPCSDMGCNEFGQACSSQGDGCATMGSMCNLFT